MVDDVDINRKIMVRILKKHGLNVDTACNGRECVDQVMANAERVSVVLMDINMPVLNGLDATRELRARGCSTPIVAVTGNAMSHQQEMCTDAGMNAFLTKPFEEHQILEVLLTTLEKIAPSSSESSGDAKGDQTVQRGVSGSPRGGSSGGAVTFHTTES